MAIVIYTAPDSELSGGEYVVHTPMQVHFGDKYNPHSKVAEWLEGSYLLATSGMAASTSPVSTFTPWEHCRLL